ncbi:anthranilate synthase component I family protein [Caulobacter sp. KR2-114]|uniref:anthranilate synthase component I family protein n=1 Tax=Caulobacter sp. KR2-114 TaxID=3400912 RepID=UPI003C0B6C7C
MTAVSLLRAPWREPAAVLAAFADEPFALGLLSDGSRPRGRWSYVARAPRRTLVLAADDPTDPFTALADLIGPLEPQLADGPPFQGGVAGLAAYDLGDRIEDLGLGRLAGWPDLACAAYPAVLAFDHWNAEVLAIGRGADPDLRARQALAWLEAPAPRATRGAALADALEADAPDAYERAVAQVVARIAAGEIFQANIARRWRGVLASGARPFDLMARLAAASPAPFAAYLNLGDRALVSNSPERFISLSRDATSLIAETRPIKGTAPRAADPEEDARLAAALATSAKDRAENLMIVDLMRNDLARISPPGGVVTPELFTVESFANVHHLVSAVRARLAPGVAVADLLRATFPPGSITGAPKVQAMKVIAGLEPPRGPFFGSLFFAGADGGFDSSVLIRTVAFQREGEGWSFELRAGAGIVADSDPAAERLETETKASAILAALGPQA